MNVRPVTLEGRAVTLVPMQHEHFDALVGLALGQGLFRWYPWPLESEAELREFFARCLRWRDEGSWLPFVTLERESGRPVGSTSFLAIDRHHRRLEIGSTWLAPAWQRTACNTEAKYLQLRHAFEDLGCIRVEFKTDSLNERSRAALLRIGATEEGTFRNHMVCPGPRIRHSVYYSVIDADWPDVKRRLEAMLARSSVPATHGAR